VVVRKRLTGVMPGAGKRLVVVP